MSTDEVKTEDEYPPEHDDNALICSFRNKKLAYCNTPFQDTSLW
jgi:hypothetical protein